MATFPHDYTMKKYGLVESDLSDDASDALEEFESYLAQLSNLKKKGGEGWIMTKEQQKKINRLSRAVCTEIELMIEDAPEEESEAKNKPEPKRVPRPEPVSQEESEEDEEQDDSIFNFFGL
jgi:hypothetical protein